MRHRTCVTRTRTITRAVATSLLWLAVCSGAASAALPAPRLLSDAAAPDGASSGARPRATTRQRDVSARVDVLTRPDGTPALGVGERVVLNLFPDVNLSMTVTDVTQHVGTGLTWSGTLDGIDLGHAVLASKNGALVGHVSMPGAVYRLGYTPGGRHVVEQIDTSVLPPEAPPVVTPLPAGPAHSKLGIEIADTAADTAAQIDVMVLYTPAARLAAGGTAAIRGEIDVMVASANQAYANNGLVQRVRLVFAGEIPFTEGEFLPNLHALRDMSPVVAWLRNVTRADLVSLIVYHGEFPPACGIGFLLPANTGGFSEVGYNVVERICATANLSYAHELAHNMGAHHDAFMMPGAAIFPYSYGWVDLVARFRTIMAYPNQCQNSGFPCERIQFFSTPNITQSGRPLGDASTADNSRTLSETANVVANFRQALTSPLALSAGVNQGAFVTGNTMQLSVGISNPGTAGTVDLYLFLVVPDGTALFVRQIPITGPAGVSTGNVVDFSSYRPIATGVPLGAPFAGNATNFVSYPWSGAEPQGGWMWVLLATTPGALADGVLNASELVAASVTPFTFATSAADP
jgi:hypothetical protein